MNKSIVTSLALAAILGFGTIATGTAWANSRVSETEFRALKVGMSEAEVQNLLGSPIRIKTYGLTSDKSWAYPVSHMNVRYLLVDFTPDGKVSSVRGRERHNQSASLR